MEFHSYKKEHDGTKKNETVRPYSGPLNSLHKEEPNTMKDDVTEIQQLLYRYCHTLDRGTVDEVMDTFHRNAVLLPRYEGAKSFIGLDAIRGWYLNYEQTVKSSVRNLRHKITCPWIQVDGNVASSVCYLESDYIDNSTGGLAFAVGRYEDKLVKEEGRWWIKERSIFVDGNYRISHK